MNYLLDLFPEIQPRSFSIASSLLVMSCFSTSNLSSSTDSCVYRPATGLVWKIWFIYNTSENTVLTIALPAIREKRLYWVQIILFWCEIDRLEDSLLDVDWFEMVRNTSIKWVDSSNQQLWGFISQKPSWLLNILLQYGTRIKSELNNNEKSIIRH